jgi:hypothetical protein
MHRLKRGHASLLSGQHHQGKRLTHSNAGHAAQRTAVYQCTFCAQHEAVTAAGVLLVWALHLHNTRHLAALSCWSVQGNSVQNMHTAPPHMKTHLHRFTSQ